MVSSSKEKIFEIYTLAELSYEKHFEGMIQDKKLLYPEKWYKIKDYKNKTEVITEAIDKGVLIKYTDKYKGLVECIK